MGKMSAILYFVQQPKKNMLQQNHCKSPVLYFIPSLTMKMQRFCEIDCDIEEKRRKRKDGCSPNYISLPNLREKIDYVNSKPNNQPEKICQFLPHKTLGLIQNN